ncbi:YaaL family protein [Bacillus sp. RG28]|uniref:YaaL family protein n=1 Tax=Gottfriedia endophytica TaxID=2820819 RepID=A0A940NL83_9BACI|nr:YaaL family protein [Gottfriedia endophytica]MBP0727329.1 YaaL family protein [Gottfriedia endophytica]
MVFFRKKGKLRDEFDEKLVNRLLSSKENWMLQEDILHKCFEPNDEFGMHVKLARAKYYFLLKEAKFRKVLISKIK